MDRPPDELQPAQSNASSPAGCLLGRVVALLVRLVLAVTALVMGAQVGLWATWRLGWGQSAAFALAILGGVCGGLLGLALAVRGVSGSGGGKRRADLMLCLLAGVFLARAGLGWLLPLHMDHVGIAYLAALGLSLIVWLLG